MAAARSAVVEFKVGLQGAVHGAGDVLVAFRAGMDVGADLVGAVNVQRLEK